MDKMKQVAEKKSSTWSIDIAVPEGNLANADANPCRFSGRHPFHPIPEPSNGAPVEAKPGNELLSGRRFMRSSQNHSGI